MQFIALTDKGKLRVKNEDYCAAKQTEGFCVLLLADGMGGANSGEVASSKAIETVLEKLNPALMKKLSLPDIPRTLKKIIKETNKLLFNLGSQNSQYSGMGTTLEICIIKDDTAYVAHIGDSRVYKISSSGDLLRLTKDHSLVEYMIDSGELTREEAVNHPQKNIITRALGTAADIEPDIISHPLSDGDVILVCSDGLTNMVSEEDILDTIMNTESISDCAKKLVDMANDAGGADNISVILARN